MKVNYTADEMRQLKEIEDRYSPKLEELFNSVYECDPNSDEGFRRAGAYNEYYRSFVKEYRAKCHQFDQYYFDGIKAKGDQAVLEDGKRQIDALLREYQQTVLESDIIQDENGVWITRENSSGKMSKKVAMESLKSELRLYFRELTRKPERKELVQYMTDRVNESPFISKEKKSRKKRTEQKLSEEVTDLFNAPYITALGGELTNILYDLSIHSFVQEGKFTDSGTAEVNGIKVKIDGFSEFKGQISTSTLKLWDAITAYLAQSNPYGIKNGINTCIEIPLKEYAEIRGISFTPKQADSEEEQKKENRRASNRKTNFKNDIERDLKRLSKFCITAKVARGKAAGDYDNLVLIYPDHSIEGDIIKINMPEDTAAYLLNAYPFYYAPELQSVSDSNPNIYRIGRKILSYNSIDRNARKGTNNTLKVKTIVSYTPFIPSLETLKANHQRNWKEKIKDPLETVMNKLVENGTLTRWQYENPRTKEIVSAEDAAGLTDSTYWNLNIQFSLKTNDDQQQRMLQKEEEFERAQAKRAEKQKNLKAKKGKSDKSNDKNHTEVGTSVTPR